MKRADLIAAAAAAREHAYAPYSGFKVGAAIELADGAVFTGVNVENCSYGLTVCAERHAIAAAVRDGARPGDVVAIAVVADADVAASPCGACRQVLAEFASPTARIFLHNLRDGATEELAFADLLPHAFDRSSLASRTARGAHVPKP